MGPGPAKLWPTVAPQWILDLPEWLEGFCYDIYKCFIFDNRYEMYIEGLGNTLLMTFLALLIGVMLGVVVALVRVTWDKNGSQMRGVGKVILAIFNAICKVYLTVIRGTPVVVQLMIWYFVVFASSRNGLMIGAFAFGINSGAYVAEIFRSGIMSIDVGQMEAGRSLGFGYIPTMQHIILPQAFKNVLPPLCNEFIVLLKETAVVGYIGLSDLTYAASTVGGATYEYLFPLLLAAAIYLIMVVFFTHLVGKLERRLRTSER